MGAFLLPVFPEQLEGFLQVVSADDRTVPSHPRGKAFFSGRHGFRHTPRCSRRFPSRSIQIVICCWLVSTLVTRWAFKRNSILIDVSMSTSVLFLSLDRFVTTMKGHRARGALLVSVVNSKDSKDFNFQYTFWKTNRKQRRLANRSFQIGGLTRQLIGIGKRVSPPPLSHP